MLCYPCELETDDGERLTMISHERIAENVYSFQSDIYAQVNAGVVVGPNWGVLIDTLAFPEETIQIRDFVEQQLSVPVRYIINTHYHADHSWGNCFFPGARVLSSALCRQLLSSKGEPSLEQSRQQNPTTFRNVRLVLPHLTFASGMLGMRVGKKTIALIPLPGHSDDGIGVLIEEDRVLFSGDACMPLPYLVDGDYEDMQRSLTYIADASLENIIQGHGDIILRGEIDNAIDSNLEYLAKIKELVEESTRYKFPLDYLQQHQVDDCGKPKVLLGGIAEALHQRNLFALYLRLIGEKPVGSDEVWDEREERRIIRSDDDEDWDE